MADVADIADQFMEKRLQSSLAQVCMQTAAGAENIDCEDCDNEIGEARRKAAPWATTCIECQSIREQRQRRMQR